MWNVQCILAAHASLRLACLLLLFNRFFRRQWIFLLRFRFLQFRLIELLNLSHIGFVRHGCRGRYRYKAKRLRVSHLPLVCLGSENAFCLPVSPNLILHPGGLIHISLSASHLPVAPVPDPGGLSLPDLSLFFL